MDRYLLDLNQLPLAKTEVIAVITSGYSDAQKTSFIKSLIFLGFSTIKQSDIDVAHANIAKSSGAKSLKVRISLTGTPIANFLSSFKKQSTKRSCVYAFLYAGISNYIEYQQAIKANADEKVLKKIEKNLFLCGLSDHFSQSFNFVVTPRAQHKITTTPPPSDKYDNDQNSNKNNINQDHDNYHKHDNQHVETNPDEHHPLSSHSPTPTTVINEAHNKARAKKPRFNIDGV